MGITFGKFKFESNSPLHMSDSLAAKRAETDARLKQAQSSVVGKQGGRTELQEKMLQENTDDPTLREADLGSMTNASIRVQSRFLMVLSFVQMCGCVFIISDALTDDLLSLDGYVMELGLGSLSFFAALVACYGVMAKSRAALFFHFINQIWALGIVSSYLLKSLGDFESQNMCKRMIDSGMDLEVAAEGMQLDCVKLYPAFTNEIVVGSTCLLALWITAYSGSRLNETMQDMEVDQEDQRITELIIK